MFDSLLTTKHKFSVGPNQTGLLYFRNELREVLGPGLYERRAKRNEYRLATISRTLQYALTTNQEVLTQDNIALRFSYHTGFAVEDAGLFATHFNVLEDRFSAGAQASALVAMYTQRYLRTLIGALHSEALNERRDTLVPAELPAPLLDTLRAYGIRLEAILLRDLTFPKHIQQLFAKKLEAKIGAEVKLTDARASVAAARALKNAATLMSDNPNIRYLRLLETLGDMARQGNHTFVLGEPLQRLGQ